MIVLLRPPLFISRNSDPVKIDCVAYVLQWNLGGFFNLCNSLDSLLNVKVDPLLWSSKTYRSAIPETPGDSSSKIAFCNEN